MASASLAVAIPSLLAFNLPPSATFLNQAAALVGWGGFLLVLADRVGGGVGAWRRGAGADALLVALALLVAAATGSAVFAGLPPALAASSVGVLLAAIAAAGVAVMAARQGHGEAAFHAFCVALVVTGVLSSAVALVQVFAPTWADGSFIAPTALPGRATGNLRQPNHLSSLLLWSAIAALWLGEAGRLRRAAATALAALFVFALMLSGSRTGLVGVVILALWGLLDRGLSRHTRVVLVLAPVFYAVCWFGLSSWTHAGHEGVFNERKFTGSGDISTKRFGIWSNTLDLIASHPWLGIGWGEFNFAWTLTPFPGRPVAFFDHTHNLPLQFAVELGLPLAAAVLALLAFALWRAFTAGRDAPDVATRQRLRAGFVMVLMIALHSQLEYPLWYAYFLLPTAFAFGLCVGADGAGAGARQAVAEAVRTVAVLSPSPTSTSMPPPRRARPLVLASLLVMAGGVLSVVDYARVVSIFAPSSGNTAPLGERVTSGQHSLFFSHHADYAAATSLAAPAGRFAGATHYLLDTRLMIAWANALAAAGDVERARHIAQRLREFDSPDAAAYFEPCDDPDPNVAEGTRLPYQCVPPMRSFRFEDFR